MTNDTKPDDERRQQVAELVQGLFPEEGDICRVCAYESRLSEALKVPPELIPDVLRELDELCAFERERLRDVERVQLILVSRLVLQGTAQ